MGKDNNLGGEAVYGLASPFKKGTPRKNSYSRAYDWSQLRQLPWLATLAMTFRANVTNLFPTTNLLYMRGHVRQHAGRQLPCPDGSVGAIKRPLVDQNAEDIYTPVFTFGVPTLVSTIAVLLKISNQPWMF